MTEDCARLIRMPTPKNQLLTSPSELLSSLCAENTGFSIQLRDTEILMYLSTSCSPSPNGLNIPPACLAAAA